MLDTPEEMIDCINELFELDFTSEEIEKRKLILEDAFSNRHNALNISQAAQELKSTILPSYFFAARLRSTPRFLDFVFRGFRSPGPPRLTFLFFSFFS